MVFGKFEGGKLTVLKYKESAKLVVKNESCLRILF